MMVFKYRITGLLAIVLVGQQNTAEVDAQLVASATDIMHQNVQDFVHGRKLSTSDFLVWNANATSILVQVIAEGPGAEDRLSSIFDDINFEKTGCSTYTCSGFVPAHGLLKLEAHEEVKFVRPEKAVAGQGKYLNEAIQALQVDLVSNAYPAITGAGITIGVISTSFNTCGNCMTHYADDIASGDLPSGIEVLLEYKEPEYRNDEGRAMMQLIHDIAPGAVLKFHTGSYGAASLAVGIQKLAEAGCNLIVDDIQWFAEPFFQDGIVAKAANDVAKLQGIPYFALAGNDGDKSWEGSFTGSGDFDEFGCEFHDFGGGTIHQKIEFNGEKGSIYFQWDDPFFSVSGIAPTRHIIAHLYTGDTGEEICTSPDVPRLNGPDPLIELKIDNLVFPQNAGVSLALAVCEPLKAGQVFMKWVAEQKLDITSIQFDTHSSTSYGKANAEFTAGVGAAYFRKTPAFGTNPPEAQVYSSLGGTPIIFDRDGTRKSDFLYLRQPRFVGTDTHINSFFGYVQTHAPNGRGWYFTGTSAAVANVAAVAALMLQMNPKLKPKEIYHLLEKTAIDMASPGFDYKTGYGLVNAYAAIEAVPPPKKMKTSKAKKNKGKKNAKGKGGGVRG